MVGIIAYGRDGEQLVASVRQRYAAGYRAAWPTAIGQYPSRLYALNARGCIDKVNKRGDGMFDETAEIIADKVGRIACRKCGQIIDVSDLESFSSVNCSACGTEQTVPAQLGQFLLLELLGTGGMGAVYKALDQTLGRYVAIKVMKRALGDNPQFIENFMREARAAAALNHPNVVQIYSCGQEKGQPYIVMELVSGGRLDEMIATGNPMDEVRALEIGIDVAEGLKAASDIGLIHGDVKPANILFDKNGVAKVVDFGLARFVGFQSESGEIWGTPYYIAPEKARGQKVDHRSDIYSLGATLYHALGAKPPFDGNTAADVVVARLKNPAIGLRVIRPSLQPETADVIARMLEADPFMRYPTYPSLIADLREALRVAKQQARATHKKTKKTPVWPFALATGAILAVLVILIVGIYRTQKHMQQQQQAVAQAQLAAATAAVQGESAAPTGTAAATSPKTQEPSTPRPPPSVLPFSKTGEQEVLKALAPLEQGNVAAARAALEQLYQRAPARGIARHWIRMLQAPLALAEGQTGDARSFLLEVRGALLEPLAGGVPHPGILPKTLAAYMLKDVDESAVMMEGAKWPAASWYTDMAPLYFGLRALQEGNAAGAQKYFDEYLSKKGDNPAWPYALHSLAQRTLEQLAIFRQTAQQIEPLLVSRQASRARTQLEALRVQTLPLLHPLVDNRIQSARVAEQKEAEERRQAERREYEKQIQADLDRIDQTREDCLPLLAQKDFRRASASLTRIISEMKTTEGQQTLALARERYDRCDALKRFLMARISASPYRAQSDLGGEAVAADLNGIRIALGAHGVMVVPWDQVSVRTMVQMANYYIQDSKVPEKDRADAALSAAVYCYENNILKGAGTFAAKAVELDSELKTKIRQLMPDVLPD